MKQMYRRDNIKEKILPEKLIRLLFKLLHGNVPL